MKQIRTFVTIIAAGALAVAIAGCGEDSPVATSKGSPGPYAQFTIDLNSDVVVNNGSGGMDTTQEAVDDSTQGTATNFAYCTQSAATQFYATDPDGLPDDGFFPETSRHPPVQLWYNNKKNGHNARRLLTNGETYNFSAGGKYTDLHLYMAAGQGNVQVTITLHYSDLNEGRNVSVPDWFNEITPNADRYYLIDGMDRMGRWGNSLNNRDDAAIFGFRIPVDDTRVLENVTVIRSAGGNSSSSVLTLFGAVGVRQLEATGPPER